MTLTKNICYWECGDFFTECYSENLPLETGLKTRWTWLSVCPCF